MLTDRGSVQVSFLHVSSCEFQVDCVVWWISWRHITHSPASWRTTEATAKVDSILEAPAGPSGGRTEERACAVLGKESMRAAHKASEGQLASMQMALMHQQHLRLPGTVLAEGRPAPTCDVLPCAAIVIGNASMQS